MTVRPNCHPTNLDRKPRRQRSEIKMPSWSKAATAETHSTQTMKSQIQPVNDRSVETCQQSYDGDQCNMKNSVEEDSSSDEPNLYRFLGLGMELAGFSLAFAIIGLILDSVLENATRYCTAFGTLLGFTLGMTHFIRQTQSSQQASKLDDRRKDGH